MEVALRYFYEAVMAGSMTLASEKLGVATSSISRQISQLEAQLGIPLIERGRRSIKPTEAGELAFRYYRDHMSTQEAFESQINDLRGVKAGRVSLAVGEGFLTSTFAEFLSDYSSANPGIEVSLKLGGTSEIIRMVLDDEADLGLVLQFPPEPKIRTRASAVQPFVVLAHPDHPLAQLKSVTLQDLSAHRLCLGPPGFRIRQIITASEAADRTSLAPVFTTDSIALMKQLAATGTMVTVLPLLAGSAEIEAGQLVARPIVSEAMEVAKISLISRLGRQLPAAPLQLLSRLETKIWAWDQEAAKIFAELKPRAAGA